MLFGLLLDEPPDEPPRQEPSEHALNSMPPMPMSIIINAELLKRSSRTLISRDCEEPFQLFGHVGGDIERPD